MAAVDRRHFLRTSARAATSVGLFAALPWALAGCEDSGGGGDGRGGAASAPVQVLVGFGTGNAPEQRPPQEALARAFASHHGGKVDYLRIPDTDEAQRRLGVLVAAGEAPDVVLPSGLWGIALFLDQRMWRDLGPYMRDSGVDLGMFQEPALQAAKATNYYGEDSDAVIGVPAGMFTHALAYNKELLADAGVEEPPHEWDDPGWTYDRMLEMAKALTIDGRGRTADQAGFDSDDIEQFGLTHYFNDFVVRGFAGPRYDTVARTMRVGSDEWIEGVQFAADLVHRHHVLATGDIAAGVAAGADDPELAAWRSQKAAMIDMCACDLMSWGADTDFEWDLAPLPKGPAGAWTHLNLDVGAIVARADNPDGAWEVLRFMLTEPDNALRLSTGSYGAMAPLESETGKFVETLAPRFPGVDLGLYVDALPHADAANESWHPAFQQVNDMGGQYYDPVFIDGEPAAPHMRELQKAAQAEVEAWLESNELPAS